MYPKKRNKLIKFILPSHMHPCVDGGLPSAILTASIMSLGKFSKIGDLEVLCIHHDHGQYATC